MGRWIAAGAVAALTLTGCTNQIADEGQGDVILRVIAVNGGSALQSDVVNELADVVPVTLAVRSKNPFHNETNYSRAVVIERYEIRYYRSDGHNTQGVDVPYNISGDLTVAIDVGEPEANVTILTEIVRRQAKLEPPLRNLRCSAGFCGQAQVLTVFAEVTVYGRQIFNGSVLSSKGSMQIDFADFSG